MPPSQVMLSYRIADAGAKELGGDGTVVRVKQHLEQRGYSVFVGETCLEGGQEWSREIQDAVTTCQAFVAVCSPGYGGTKWTFREFQLADNEDKHIIPLWHSGAYPPAAFKLHLSGTQRVPHGDKPLADCDFGDVMAQLEVSLRLVGCKPLRPPSVRSQALGQNPQQQLLAADAVLAPLAPLAPQPPQRQPSTQASMQAQRLTVPDGATATASTAATITSAAPAAHPGSRWADSAQPACLLILLGHAGGALSVAWSPDGKQLASGSGDGLVRIWDPASGKPLRSLTGHHGNVHSLCWAPEGRLLATGSDDRTIRIWDTATGSCVRTMVGHTDYVRCVAWAPDGRQLASAGGCDKAVRLWDSSTGICVRTMVGHTNYVRSVAWGPDGGHLASGSRDKTVRLWDPASGSCLRTLNGHTDFVRSVAWTPNGRQLASGGRDKAVRVWDVAGAAGAAGGGGRGAAVRTLSGHTGDVVTVAWAPDGRLLASGGTWDRAVRVWDVCAAAGGGCVCTLSGHTGDVLGVAWAPDGSHIASAGSSDNSVRVWGTR